MHSDRTMTDHLLCVSQVKGLTTTGAFNHHGLGAMTRFDHCSAIPEPRRTPPALRRITPVTVT
eukprot:6242045-Pyramimonas_sp.AAC.1